MLQKLCLSECRVSPLGVKRNVLNIYSIVENERHIPGNEILCLKLVQNSGKSRSCYFGRVPSLMKFMGNPDLVFAESLLLMMGQSPLIPLYWSLLVDSIQPVHTPGKFTLEFADLLIKH